MELDIAPDGRVFYIERDGRVQIIKPDTGTTVTAVDLDVFTGNEDGLLGIRLDPDFATNNWVYLYYAPNDGVTRNRLSRFTVTGDTHRPGQREGRAARSTTQRNTCCHAGGSMTFDSAGNLYLATGDNTNPFESDAFTPIDERAGRQDYDAQRTAGNTNDLRGKVLRIHPEADGTYTVPAGQPLPGGHRADPPGDLRDGLPQPVPDRHRPEDQHALRRRLRAGRRRGQPQPRPRGHGRVEHRRRARQLRLAVLHTARTTPTTTTRSRPARAGAKFDCAAPVNNSPNNTGLTNLPPAVAATVDYDYGGNPRFPEIGGGGAPMGGPVYRYDADLNSDRKWPAYYDGKAMFGEWNQNKMYTMQVTADGKSLVDINQLLTGDDVHPADGLRVRPGRRAVPDRVGHRLRRQQRRLRASTGSTTSPVTGPRSRWPPAPRPPGRRR